MFNHPRFGATLLIALTAPARAEDPVFLEICSSGCWPRDVSGDGRVVVGQNSPDAFSWSLETGYVTLPACPGDENSVLAMAASFDGSVIVGWVAGSSCNGGTPPAGATWSEGFCGVFPAATVWATSGDGTILGGHTCPAVKSCSCQGEVPMLWSAGGSTPLPGGEGKVNGISDDGTVAVGTLFGSPPGFAIWTDGQLQNLGTGVANAVTPDGSVVVGQLGGNAVRWTEAGGVVVLGPGGAFDVSADGSVVLGLDFIWDEVEGTRSLETFLVAEGLDVGGFTFLAEAISDDGTVIVGRAFSGSWVGFVADLDPGPVDTDGDGLLDPWESDGIDVDGDGTVDLDLPAMGANPDRKDLFVEVDAMLSIVPDSAALDQVVVAFAAAPLGNPDGTTGVTLHYVIDELDLPLTIDWDDSGGLPADFDQLRNDHFGTVEERNHPAAADLIAAKREVFRHCIYAHSMVSDVLGFSATTTVAAGNTFVLARDDIALACAASGACAAYEAAVFMHELGHSLGLDHGGGDLINGKPNYISVMNYLSHLPFAEGVTWRLDYSHGTMPTLDEQNLDETSVFRDVSGVNEGVTTFFGPVGCGPPSVGGSGPLGACCLPDESCLLETPGGCSVLSGRYQGDGSDCAGADCSLCQTVPDLGAAYRAAIISSVGFADLDGDDNFTAGVCQDLNYFGEDPPIADGQVESPCELLNDNNDWAALQYAPAPETAAPGGGTLPDELTVSAVLYLRENLPVPCPADIGGDGSVGIDDFLGLLASWNAPPPSLADVDRDGVVGVLDLLELLAAWGPCP